MVVRANTAHMRKVHGKAGCLPSLTTAHPLSARGISEVGCSTPTTTSTREEEYKFSVTYRTRWNFAVQTSHGGLAFFLVDAGYIQHHESGAIVIVYVTHIQLLTSYLTKGDFRDRGVGAGKGDRPTD